MRRRRIGGSYHDKSPGRHSAVRLRDRVGDWDRARSSQLVDLRGRSREWLGGPHCRSRTGLAHAREKRGLMLLMQLVRPRTSSTNESRNIRSGLSLLARFSFGLKSLSDQPANGLRTGWLIGLRAAPVIDGLFEMRGEPEGQDWVLPDCWSPALFSYYGIRVRHALYYEKNFSVGIR
jgi:hypothetical protein